LARSPFGLWLRSGSLRSPSLRQSPKGEKTLASRFPPKGTELLQKEDYTGNQ